MASTYLSYAMFAILCLVLLTLPFVPAYREWRRPTDLQPLAISPDDTSNIDHFSARMRSDVLARLGLGTATGYEEFEFVNDPVEAMVWIDAKKRLISRSSIDSEKPIRTLQPLYVEGSIKAGPDSSFLALYAAGDIDLGAESEIHDWAHAEGVLSLARNCVALRRISAGKAVELGAEVWFERLAAPSLHFGSRPVELPELEVALPLPASYADLPHAIQQTPLLYLVRGNCTLRSGRTYRGSLVVTGFLSIGANTTVVGDIKAHEGISLGQGVFIDGATTCTKRIYVLENARVLGPVISENDILIGSNTQIGLLESPTTVTARNIIVEEGAVVHGAIWAHEIGMVKPV